MRSETIRAAAVQLNAGEDFAANLATADRLVRHAAGLGAEFVVLPEKFSQLGRAEPMDAGAQPLDGEVGRWASGIAAEVGIDLVAGSVVERVPGRDRTSNTSAHYGPDGGLRAAYRKLHMFDVEVDGVVYAESEREQPGEEVVVSVLAGGSRLGLTICYDVRFPELYRALSARDVDVIAVPAAFTLATTRDHWETLLRARAIENQCFVVAANQIGAHPPGNRSGGRSMIVDPWGVVLATAPDSECTVLADLDLALMADVRRRLPALTHRRSEAIYAAAARTEPSA